MTMQEWLTQTFTAQAQAGEGYINIGNVQSEVDCDPNWLANQLGANVPPIYAQIQAQPIYSIDGWTQIIDQWHANGIV